MFDKIFIVIDLDRANNNEIEIQELKKLISIIKKLKGQAFLFLSYKNFEVWLMYHFKDNSRNNEANFLKTMGFESSKDFKANSSNLYNQIVSKGGSIENAENYFRKRDLFCNRDCSINKNNINHIQSNLYYF
ncbi:RloB domain-containing protein, partial [Helicobacter pullorum]